MMGDKIVFIVNRFGNIKQSDRWVSKDSARLECPGLSLITQAPAWLVSDSKLEVTMSLRYVAGAA